MLFTRAEAFVDIGTSRAVVLAGEGPSFCAGADVTWMRAAMALDREANEQDAMAMAEMFEAIDSCPAPVIARVHGSALGGGYVIPNVTLAHIAATRGEWARPIASQLPMSVT